MIRVRLATPFEASEFQKSAYKTTVLILEDDGLRIGQACLTTAPDGTLIGHDAAVESANAHAYSVLTQAVRERVKLLGFNEMYVHTDENTPKRIHEFWARMHAKQVAVVYRVSVE
jgi:hypothetical protein